MSEIDDIFASKGKPKALVQHVSASSVSSSSKKRKKKQSSTAVKMQTATESESSKKRRLPDTIVDTSHELPLAKRRKWEKSKHGNPENKSEDIVAFKDSRGNTGRRPFSRIVSTIIIHPPPAEKRTEEGWLIYKEDDLGINDQGGRKILSILSLLIPRLSTRFDQTRNCVHLIVIAVSLFQKSVDGNPPTLNIQASELISCYQASTCPRPMSGFFEASPFAFHDTRGQYEAKKKNSPQYLLFRYLTGKGDFNFQRIHTCFFISWRIEILILIFILIIYQTFAFYLGSKGIVVIHCLVTFSSLFTSFLRCYTFVVHFFRKVGFAADDLLGIFA